MKVVECLCENVLDRDSSLCKGLFLKKKVCLDQELKFIFILKMQTAEKEDQR